MNILLSAAVIAVVRAQMCNETDVGALGEIDGDMMDTCIGGEFTVAKLSQCFGSQEVPLTKTCGDCLAEAAVMKHECGAVTCAANMASDECSHCIIASTETLQACFTAGPVQAVGEEAAGPFQAAAEVVTTTTTKAAVSLSAFGAMVVVALCF